MSEYLDYAGLLRYHELIDGKKADKADIITDVVRYGSQSLTTELKALARSNIGAGTLSSLNHTITVKSGKKSDGSTDITATSTSASSPSVTLGASGVTANGYGDTSALTPSYGATFKVPYIKVNEQGIVVEASEHTVKIPASDNTNTATAVDNILDGSNSGTAITYAPYTSLLGKLSFDTSTTAPSRTDRLNLNGYFYATKLYSGGTEVLTSHLSLVNYAPKASPALTGTPTAPTAAVGTNTTQIATTEFVLSAITNGIAANDAMVYSGTIAGGSTGNYGALTPAASKGNTYKVTTAGKINGIAVEIGDMLICNTDSTAAATSSNYSTIAANWDFIQANIDGAVTGPASSTAGHIATFDGTTGKVIKDSGYTIATSVPSGAVFTDTHVTSSANHYTPATGETANVTASGNTTLTRGTSLVITAVTTDSKGHVVKLTTGKMPASDNTDTKVTSVDNHYKATGVAAETKSASGATGTAEATVQVITGVTTDAAGHVTGIVSGAATDTDTKVTSAANHYTPATASGSDVTANASGATAAWSIDVVKGITLNTDGKGHITGMSVTSGKIPANPNTDTKVSDTNGTGKAFLLGHTTQGTTATAISNASVYMSGGKLYSNGKEVAIAENIPSLSPISYGSGATLDNTKQIDSLFITA